MSQLDLLTHALNCLCSPSDYSLPQIVKKQVLLDKYYIFADTKSYESEMDTKRFPKLIETEV